MNYSTINASKIRNKADLVGRTRHCLRQGGEDATHQKSIDPTKTHLNRHFALNDEMQLEETDSFSLNESIDKMAKHVGAKFRKDGAVATELVVGASKEWINTRTPEQLKKWIQDNLDAANEKFPGQVFGASYHADETSPHIHIYVLPWYKKEVKQRPRKDGRPSRRKPRIGVSHNVVMPHYQKLHDWYNEAMRKAGWSLVRGQPKKLSGKTYGELKRRAEIVTEEANNKEMAANAMMTLAGMAQNDAELAAAQIKFDAERQLEIAANAKADILNDWETMKEGVKTFKALDELSKFMKATIRMLEAYKNVLPEAFFSGKPSKIDDLNEHLEFIETLNRTEFKKEMVETVKEAQPIFQKHNNTENEKPRGLSF